MVLCFIGLIAIRSAPAAESRKSGWHEYEADAISTNDVCAGLTEHLVDDSAIIRKLERAGREAIDNESFVPVRELIRQLDRGTHEMRLKSPGLRKLAPPDIYRRCAKSVLIVAEIYKCPKCGQWHAGPASGFLISESGAFVTCYHVVNDENTSALLAMTYEGEIYPVKEVLAASRRLDLAILQLETGDDSFEALPVSRNAPAPGEPVTVISHPARRFYSLTHGMVSRYHRKRARGGAVPVMTVTADFARGSSGAPVLDDHGGVVGIVESTNSIYYSQDEEEEDKRNLQMVARQCIPAQCLLELIK